MNPKATAVTIKDPAIIREVPAIIAEASEIEITSEFTLHHASEVLTDLNRRNDAISAEKERMMRPLLDAAKVERSRWANAETLLKTAIDSIRRKMIDYKTAADLAAEKEKERIAKRIGDGRGKLSGETAIRQIQAVETVADTIEMDSSSVTFIEKENFRITDPKKIPIEYMLVNEVAIRRAMKDGTPISGVEYFTEKIPRNNR